MTPERLLDLLRGFRAPRALLTAIELDLFTLLDEGPRAAADLARVAGASERGVEALLGALAALGLIERRAGGTYANVPEVGRALSRKSPEWRGAAGFRENDLFARWARLSECVRTGRPPEVLRAEREVLAIQLARHHDALPAADAIAAALPLEGKKRVIDLAGGTGTIAAALLRLHPGATATIVDLPLVLDVAKRVLPKEWLKEGRLRLRAGNLIEDMVPAGFELALVSDVLSGYAPAEARRVLRRARDALVPGGHLAVRDRFEPGLRALDLLVDTPAGRVHARAEVEEWTRQAGFADSRWTRVEGDADHDLLIARRSAD